MRGGLEVDRETLIRELTPLRKGYAVLVPRHPQHLLDHVQLRLVADYLDQANEFLPLGHPTRNIVSKCFPAEAELREPLSVYTLYIVLNTVIVTLGGESVDIPF